MKRKERVMILFSPFWMLAPFLPRMFHSHLPPAVVPKVIMTTARTLSTVSDYKEKFPSVYREKDAVLIEIAMGMKPRETGGPSISFDTVYATLDKTSTIPVFHPYSRFHYENVYQARFGRVVSYNDYCRLEDATAKIVIALVHDTRSRVHYMIVFPDDGWLESESLVSYMTSDEYENTLRMSFLDLDDLSREAVPLREPTQHHYRVYSWDRRDHPLI